MISKKGDFEFGYKVFFTYGLLALFFAIMILTLKVGYSTSITDTLQYKESIRDIQIVNHLFDACFSTTDAVTGRTETNSFTSAMFTDETLAQCTEDAVALTLVDKQLTVASPKARQASFHPTKTITAYVLFDGVLTPLEVQWSHA